jgi:hypothetical protein
LTVLWLIWNWIVGIVASMKLNWRYCAYMKIVFTKLWLILNWCNQNCKHSCVP